MRVIPCLKPFCRFTYAMPNERSSHPAAYRHVSASEMDNRNHSVIRIAEAKIWNMITHDPCLFAVSSRGQHDNSHVPVGRGKFVPVDVDKADRIGVAC